MATYNGTLRRFSTPIRNGIKTTVTEWLDDELGACIAPNIQRETILPGDPFEAILNVIHRCRRKGTSPLDTVRLAKEYKDECYKYVRHGRKITVPSPPIIGRAIPRKHFITYLKGEYDLKDWEAEELLQKLRWRKKLTAPEGNLLMSKFSAWVTWNRKAPSGNPFAFARKPHRRTKVFANLGLDPKDLRRPLILLVYRTRPSTPLLHPTIADAGTHRYFQVVDSGQGLTKPWPPPSYTMPIQPQPRPEAVHRPESLSQLQYVRVV